MVIAIEAQTANCSSNFAGPVLHICEGLGDLGGGGVGGSQSTEI